MRRYSWLTWVLCIFLLLFANQAEAKLTIIPPSDMIEQSSLIVIGTIKDKQFSDDQRQVTLAVETWLKGSLQDKELVLQRDKYLMYGWLGFDFPDKGTRVMVLLQQSDPFVLTGETNSVAVLEGKHNVKLYKGTTMGQWTTELYEEAYSAFLEKRMSSLLAPKSVDNSNDIATILSMKPGFLKDRAYIYITIALACTVLLATGCYRMFKHKKDK